MNTPTLVELAVRLGNAGPQWRPVAHSIAAELVADLKALYPKMPEGAAELSAAVTVRQALRMAAQARAASLSAGTQATSVPDDEVA